MKSLSLFTFYYLLIILINFNYQSVSCTCKRLSSIKVECKNVNSMQQLNSAYKNFWKIVHIINNDSSKAYFVVASK